MTSKQNNKPTSSKSTKIIPEESNDEKDVVVSSPNKSIGTTKQPANEEDEARVITESDKEQNINQETLAKDEKDIVVSSPNKSVGRPPVNEETLDINEDSEQQVLIEGGEARFITEGGKEQNIAQETEAKDDPFFNIDKIYNEEIKLFFSNPELCVEFTSTLKKLLNNSSYEKLDETKTVKEEVDHSQSVFNKVQFFNLKSNKLENLDGTKSDVAQVPDWVNGHPVYEYISVFKGFAADLNNQGVVYVVFTRFGLIYFGQTGCRAMDRFKNTRWKRDFCHIKLMELASKGKWQTISDFVLGLMDPSDIFITAIKVSNKDGLYNRVPTDGFGIKNVVEWLQKHVSDQKDVTKKALDLIERMFIGLGRMKEIPLLNDLDDRHKARSISRTECETLFGELKKKVREKQ